MILARHSVIVDAIGKAVQATGRKYHEPVVWSNEHGLGKQVTTQSKRLDFPEGQTQDRKPR